MRAPKKGYALKKGRCKSGVSGTGKRAARLKEEEKGGGPSGGLKRGGKGRRYWAGLRPRGTWSTNTVLGVWGPKAPAGKGRELRPDSVACRHLSRDIKKGASSDRLAKSMKKKGHSRLPSTVGRRANPVSVNDSIGYRGWVGTFQLFPPRP